MKIIEIKDADLIAFIGGIVQYSPVINDGDPLGEQLKTMFTIASERITIADIAFVQIEEKYFYKLEKALELTHHAYCNVPLNDRVVDNSSGRDIVAIYFQWMEPKVQELRDAMKQLVKPSILH